MKVVGCSKCINNFEMPDDFVGTIVCEDCDPFMGDVLYVGGTVNPELIERPQEIADYRYWRRKEREGRLPFSGMLFWSAVGAVTGWFYREIFEWLF